MPGLDPGIHDFLGGQIAGSEGVDGRVKPGHADLGLSDDASQATALRFRGNDDSI